MAQKWQKAVGLALSYLFYAVLIAAMALPQAVAVAQKKVPLEAQIAGDLDRTRFVAFLSQAVSYKVFLLADPYRIVVDLPGTDIQVPGDPGRGLVFAARAGSFSEGKSRIVIDLTEPAIVENSGMLPPENGLPARLVIDLKRTTPKLFLAAANSAESIAARKSASVQLNAKPAGEERSADDNKPVIVIDPGHGGVDGGAVGQSGTIEKDVTLLFGKALKDHLTESGRYRVVLTRTIDLFVPLDERVNITGALKADLFISLHADALDPKNPFGVKSVQDVRGATFYTQSETASDAEAQAMAQRENKSDVFAGLKQAETAAFSEELQDILADLDSRIKKNRSISFARMLHSQLKGKIAFNVKPNRSADFRVLQAPGVPSVLFELGYLSNAEDEKLLSSPDWQKTITSEVALAINTFMTERQAQLPF